MAKRIVFMGAGAVGSSVGGHIARSGEDVTLIDPGQSISRPSKTAACM
jgi:ketopantoate reductase